MPGPARPSALFGWLPRPWRYLYFSERRTDFQESRTALPRKDQADSLGENFNRSAISVSPITSMSTDCLASWASWQTQRRTSRTFTWSIKSHVAETRPKVGSHARRQVCKCLPDRLHDLLRTSAPVRHYGILKHLRHIPWPWLRHLRARPWTLQSSTLWLLRKPNKWMLEKPHRLMCQRLSKEILVSNPKLEKPFAKWGFFVSATICPTK